MTKLQEQLRDIARHQQAEIKILRNKIEVVQALVDQADSCEEVHIPVRWVREALCMIPDYLDTVIMHRSAWEKVQAEISGLRAELEFQRAWCSDNLGIMPPTREMNAAFLRAVDET